MPTVHQRYGWTDGRTMYDSNIALALRASRGKNLKKNILRGLNFFTTLNSSRSRQNGWTDLHEIFREGVD